ncbi:MAG: LysE family transporter [Jaaginema sp. PMC 1080.18]|nr:LysE family transporter [Jaaginema sp. PMC 1080.18]
MFFLPLLPLLQGLLLGFAIAAPVGPIGVLCIQRTIQKGRLTGFLSGLGAATADGIYGGIAAFGLAGLTQWLVAQKMWLGLFGGLFLCYLGTQTLRKPPVTLETTTTPTGALSAYITTVGLTLTNPATILSFTAIFAGLGFVTQTTNTRSALLLTLGVFIGSALWWLLLSLGVGWLRLGNHPKRLRWINYIAGIIIIAFGIVTLWSSLF